MENIKVKHSGNTGDIIYSLTSLKQLCDLNNCKANYYIQLNAKSTFTSKTHPVGDVMMNEKMYTMLKPLLEAQYYIDVVEEYTDQDIDLNLDMFRHECYNLSAGDIKLWYHHISPLLKGDVTEKCLFSIPVIEDDYIVINRTTRYISTLHDYSILESFGKKIYFVGVEDEFKIMKAIMPDLIHYEVCDFWELSRLIAGCILFVGNQSMAFAMAEQMKVNRVLEQHYGCPNVIPQGGQWAVFQSQKQFENIIKSIKFE